MYKIFSYIGSYRGEKSDSLRITNDLIRYLEDELNEELRVREYTPNKFKINECRGCVNCFLSGKCIINDDINEMKRNMKESDIIIFSSPVYFHQISGATKTFIDRISHWAHTLELRGKIGVAINISDSNGNKFVEEYLEKVMSSLGIIVVKNISMQMAIIKEEVAVENILRLFARQISSSIKNKSFNSSAIQEIYFQSMKTAMMNKPDDDFEKKYWIDNEMMQCNNFKKIFNENCRILNRS